MSLVITPTVGRKVWYRPSASDLTGPCSMSASRQPKAQPLDASIIAVWGDRMVNVLVTDMIGRQFPVLSVDLLQAGDVPALHDDGTPVGRYVEWPPYQSAQAAKDRESDAKVAAAQSSDPVAIGVVTALCGAAGVDTSAVDFNKAAE